MLNRALVAILLLIAALRPVTRPLLASEARGAPGRSDKQHCPQIILFAVVSLVCAAAAALLLPSPDVQPRIATNVSVLAPLTLPGKSDGVDSEPIELYSIGWLETHGVDTQFDVFKDSNILPESPVPYRSATVRAMVLIQYRERVPRDTPLEVEVSLPRSARLIGCSGAKVSCQKDETPTYVGNPFDRDLAPTERIIIRGTLKESAQTFAFVIDVEDVTELTFASSRTRAQLKFPMWGYKSNSLPETNFHVRVTSGALLADADKYDWGQRPSVPSKSMIAFSFLASATSDTSESSPILGVRNDVLRGDSDRTFWAGIFLGTGGGAIIAFLQQVLAAVLSRRRQVD